MGIFNTEEEKETQKLQRQEFLAQKLRDEKVRTEEILKNEEYTERLTEKELEKETLSNLSDRDIQVEILKTNRKMSGWITFIGWVTLISLIGSILLAIIPLLAI
jgi:rRNA maturation endonuclease Nob1